MFSINLNGKDSYKDFNLIVEERPNIPTPEKKYITVAIPGTGDYRREVGYEDIKININFAMISNLDNFESRRFEVINWLENIKDTKLFFSEDSNYYYNIKAVNISDFENKGYNREITQLSVEFICSPFKEAIENLPLELDISKNNTLTYNNRENVKLSPQIHIFGSGSCQIQVGDILVELKDVQEEVIVDSRLMECYKGNRSMNNLMKGYFPYFQLGENKIGFTNISGTFTTMKIYPNKRRI